LAWLFVAALAACSPASRHARQPPTTPASATPAEPIVQVGLASWYGSFHAGQRTSSGEVFDPDAMTAAHRTWPFGSVVRVTNIATGRSVTVRINDWGPHDDSRIIDLSRRAAHALGFSPDSVMEVKIERLSSPAQ
jgi:rare lipoprotein A